jgi:hypothetical protein
MKQPIVEKLLPEPGRKKATTDAGGGISHHHENGCVLRQWMTD